MVFELRPIEPAEGKAAARLLTEGFPSHGPHYWDNAVERLFLHANAQGASAVGQFISAKGADVGLCLVIPSTRHAYVDKPRHVANISSFYLRAGHEWMAPLVMRRLIADRGVEHTDLTASHSMRELNRKLGFHDLSRGAVTVPLPLAMLRPSLGARILSLERIPPGAMRSDHRQLLERHSSLGCFVCGLRTNGEVHPLIFAVSRRRGLDGARVILARDRNLLRDGMGAIARHLLGHRLAFLEFEAMSRKGFPLALFWTITSPYQSTAPDQSDAIDHTFSELVFLPPPGARRLPATGTPVPARHADQELPVRT